MKTKFITTSRNTICNNKPHTHINKKKRKSTYNKKHQKYKEIMKCNVSTMDSNSQCPII